MNATIDLTSLELLRSLRGATILEVSALRYPSCTGYSDVRLLEPSGRVLAVTLRMVDVTPEIEVAVLVVRTGEPFARDAAVDRFSWSAFVVREIRVLHRREIVGPFVGDDSSLVGQRPVSQAIVEEEAADRPDMHRAEGGVFFGSTDGTTLSLIADSFPLVLQLSLRVAGSELPPPGHRTL